MAGGLRRPDRRDRRAPRADHLLTVHGAGPDLRVPGGPRARRDQDVGRESRRGAREPRPGFPALAQGVAWDAVQVAYFTSCATWNYLAAPFSFSYPGVTAHEIEPWNEDGQEWRRLAVSFPEAMPNHNPDQVFYYDSDFMQRRMDYLPDVTGILIAHYTHDRRTFDGFVFPTRRLIHPRGPSGVADQSFAPITIDVEKVTVHRRG